MIKVLPTTALMIYLALTLGTVLWIWILHHLKSRKRKLITVEKVLMVCEYCHFPYLMEVGRHITRCPQCQSYNKNGKP